ncbi:cyclin [Emericellopsis atlantica]|uniref:Cyclin n=1 Tax=Emericellopsis atlantica TaxID=2614577 RepID=A0A9P7ZUP7_9HYPO|nr:cyclin [Emericellopsis atlantica]KAG9258684.1 cyclin [Emericellopsis atlantica]
MNYEHDASPGFVQPVRNNIYNSSISSAASASTASIWSTASASSQGSDDSSIFDGPVTSQASDSDSCDSFLSRKGINQPSVVPTELRQNPRRSAAGRAAPPLLVRQSDRKVDFVDNLVDSSTQIVEAIWPTSSSLCRREQGSKGVLPLRTFIQETLRRSRTSFSTLQVALYYLLLIKPRVPSHRFIMEQFDDRAATQSLLCGRRMFLAALILASKYLQDRNYSARAWSKISGLNTQEINQNEIAFLQAVDWKLHICKDVYQAWADIVHKFTPPSGPSSPGGCSQLVSQQHEVWRHIILGLDADLSNIEALVISAHSSLKASDLSLASPRSILNMAQEAPTSTPAPRSTPAPMEPTPFGARATGRMGPTTTQLPTPRLTPQSNGLSTPAAGAAPSTLSRSNAMASAMSQATVCNTAHYLDRLPTPASSSPQSYSSIRRSSLANSVSTASSPESMISDSSRLSRSSSFSSVSSSASATLPSRFRTTKPGNERLSRKPSFPSVPEQDCDIQESASPGSYTGPVGHVGDWSVPVDHNLTGRKRQLGDMMNDAASNAARTLQELRRSRGAVGTHTTNDDTPLQSNVRDLLNVSYGQSGWPASMLETRYRPEYPDRKRVCCSTEASRVYNATPAFHVRALGMWQGILN